MALPAFAQQGRLKLDVCEALAAKASNVVDITLDGPGLRMASRILEKDPEARAMIQGLTGIFVKVFEFDKPGGYTSLDLEGLRAQLQPAGWARITQVKSRRDGDVEIYLLEDGKGGNVGLTVLAMQPREVAVVNILGPIDVAKLSSLEGKMGIPKLSAPKTAKQDGGK
jgi:hypothetical protein